MSRYSLIQSVFAVGLSLLLAGTQAPKARDALARWEAFGQRVDYQDLLSCADAVRDNTTRGDSETFNRVIGIVRSKTQALISRLQALRVACEIADDEGSRQLLEMMQGTSLEVRRARDRGEDFGAPEGAPYANTTFLGTFIRDGVPNIIDVMREQKPLLAFLKSCYLYLRSPATRSKCAQMIAECKAPLIERQKAVVEIIGTDLHGVVRPALLGILDPSAFPELRRMVRAGDTPDRFNFSAASALSYLGDQAIIPDLEARRPGFRAVHRNRETVLRQYLWRIEVQHPPAKLLEYIASTGLRQQHYEMRMWAVQRAHELGVDRGEIRQAILRHVKNASTPLERAEVTYLKWIGMELGILQDTDLPEVTIGDTGVTP